jgi:glycine/D-amino acid oxidase-like deaminating enzyme
MGRTRERNLSWWMQSEPPQARPALGTDVDVDVAVVGGGLTGIATAAELRARGVEVVVREADRIASGSTGFTTAKVTALHGLRYADLVRRHGASLAQQYADANAWAVERVVELDPDAQRFPAVTYTTDPSRRHEIEDEVEAARSLRLPASLVTTADLPFGIAAGVRFDDQAQIHPRRLTLRLAEGLDVYEQTRVVDLAEHSDGVELTTEHGTVRARHAVLATLLPFDDAGAFFAKTEPVRSYAMAVRIDGGPPSGMYLGVDSPTRSFRPLTFDDGEVGLVVGGNGHRVGEEDDTPGQYQELEAWARATFAVRTVEARWSAQDYVPVDHVPYIGRSPRRRHTLVATGFQKWGMTTAFVAGSILADAITGRENPWSEVFDASRADVAESAKEFVTTNAHILKPFVQGHLRRTRRCTHLGCLVTWNEAERSWDCPCHGSRFAEDGAVLEGPATTPVSVDTDPER